MKPVCLPDKYEILGELGAGGMGQVYHARDRTLQREVALKVLSAKFALHTEFVERFRTEARAAASLNHPNIVQIYDFGDTDGTHFLAMELVRGNTLKAELKKVGRFSESQTLDLLLIICRTLAVAHRAGIVHRDVKPDNLMFTEGREFKLVDLGLAKSLNEDSSHTMTGQCLGSPHFISPEQITGERTIDARADIYSLGATMYNLATGCVPFDGGSGGHIMARHLSDPLPDPRLTAPQLSMGFCQVLGRMMAKTPEDRYQSMVDLEKDILVLQQGEQVPPTAAVPSGVQDTIFTSGPAPMAASAAIFWDEKSLAKVIRHLTEHVGPLASILVKKSSSRSANWSELGRELAGHIPHLEDREKFVRSCQKLDAGVSSSTLGSAFSTHDSFNQTIDTNSLPQRTESVFEPAFALAEADLKRVVGILAQRIGPVAGALVRKEMKKARNLHQLTEALACSLEDEKERNSFSVAINAAVQSGQ